MLRVREVGEAAVCMGRLFDDPGDDKARVKSFLQGLSSSVRWVIAHKPLYRCQHRCSVHN